ncbi:RDD family protein [Caulobacter sp. KR2-114]|uniref:RDD family protein n=1 Tax=Caulobacter sp. KR2-114 TaxID=3400912 RepID=UPI003BFEE03C
MAAPSQTAPAPRRGLFGRPRRPRPAPVDPANPLVREFVTPEGVDLRLQLGGAGERAAAFLLDEVISFFSIILLSWLFGLILESFGIQRALKGGDQGAEFVWAVQLLVLFLLRNFYFVFFELRPRAATPGKMMLGLRVASRDGGRLTSEAIFTRNAMREIEVFMPLTFILIGWIMSLAGGEQVDGWIILAGIVWTGIFMFFPLFNRDRLRVGDFLAGTWVVKAPRRALAIDLAQDAHERLVRFPFTPEQTAAYGIKELQVLEDVLRRRDARTMAAVAERIRRKIDWRPSGESDADFLAAYYAALRNRLENRLLFGHRRKDKFDKA